MQVAVYQYEARDEPASAKLDRLEAAIASLGKGGADLIVCPELFVCGYNSGKNIELHTEERDGAFAKAIGKIAAKWRTAVTYGHPEAVGSKRYNSASLIGADGKLTATHRKLRLPSDYERTWFSPGDSLTFAEVAGTKVAVLVCYDIEFPETVRACARAGAQLIVAPTALGREWSFVAHKLVPSRAFENNVYLAYANFAGSENGLSYLGASCIVAPNGDDLARAGPGEAVISACVDVAAIAVARNRLPYLSDSERLCDLGLEP